ncbi:MAG: hypothetical protein C4582_00675 [Desulfobacteraceae bacterium]|nr:MAG: hypothetical protein C4582_00675 [Desulfobacteraceae bacterium]
MNWESDMVLLGTGGRNPGVERYNAQSGVLQGLVHFPPGHSAYAMDIEAETGVIGIGTKGGMVHLISGCEDSDSDQNLGIRHFLHGAPVLSVCWVDSSRLAVSDTASRCLVWQTAEPRQVSLEVRKGNICFLLTLPDGLLAGLSSKGILHFWEPKSGKLIQTVRVPLPPSMYALVNIRYWEAEQALVFPGLNGHFVQVGLKNHEIRKTAAHSGELYALAPWRHYLLTAGMNDGRIKLWEPGLETPLRELVAPKGIIAMSAIESSSLAVLLVMKDGTAEAHTVENESLRPSSILPGKDYRVATTPPMKLLETLRVRKNANEARQIIEELNRKTGAVSEEEIAPVHSRLIALGYRHVSLAYRASHAEKNLRFLDALRYRSAMMALLPTDRPESCTSMLSYAALLIKTWNLLEAETVCRNILNLNPTFQAHIELQAIRELAKRAVEPCLIKTELRIEDIVESANIIGKAFIGQYVIRSLEPSSCQDVELQPEEIARKYEEILEMTGQEGLPSARTESLWWLSDTYLEKVTVIKFGDGPTSPVPGLVFALQVQPSQFGTTVVPLVLFDWHANGGKVHEENAQARKALEKIRTKTKANPYLRAIHQSVHQAIQRLLGAHQGKRRYGS